MDCPSGANDWATQGTTTCGPPAPSWDRGTHASSGSEFQLVGMIPVISSCTYATIESENHQSTSETNWL